MFQTLVFNISDTVLKLKLLALKQQRKILV